MTVNPPREDLYFILGVSPSASDREIRDAYRRAAKAAQPDISNAPEATRWMIGLNIAREWLTDPDLRARYDSSRRASASTRSTGGPKRPVRRTVGWRGLWTMPPTSVLLRWDPFPGRGECPVCRSPYDDQIAHRPARQPLPGDERLAHQPPHCALGHVEAFRPNFRDVVTAPTFGWDPYGRLLKALPYDELVFWAGNHLNGLPYPNPDVQAMHANVCPWAAGTGQRSRFFEEPNWPISSDYKKRAEWVNLDPELVAFLAPGVSEEVLRKAFSSTAAGRIALAVEDGNWLAAVFAGRWAYDVRVRRDASGRPDSSQCNCFRPAPCVHAIATWIVWAAGTVRRRPRGPQPPGTIEGSSAEEGI